MALRKTLGDLRLSVRDNLDEAVPAMWMESQLTRYLNRAIARVWNETRKLRDDFFLIARTSLDGTVTILGESYDCAGFRLVAGTREYTLPQDLTELKTLECITSGQEGVGFRALDLAKPEFRSLRTLPDAQPPSELVFDVVGERQLVLAVSPTITLDLRIWYVPILAPLVDEGDTLQMPHPLDLVVIDYATAFAMKQDRDPSAAAFEASGRSILTEFFGASRRQGQDNEYVESFMADLTGW